MFTKKRKSIFTLNENELEFGVLNIGDMFVTSDSLYCKTSNGLDESNAIDLILQTETIFKVRTPVVILKRRQL